MNYRIRSEYILGLFIFWGSIILVSLGFYLKSPWSYTLFVFILPIMFGTHEAIHENFLPNSNQNTFKRIHNDIILLVGGSFQIMNFKLLRQAHLKHHALGRYGDGYSPDITTRPPKFIDFMIYYFYLTFIPAFLYQLASFVLVFVPARYLPFDFKLELHKDKSQIPYFVVQVACLFFLFLSITYGGIQKFFIYETFLVFVWSVLQNSAHYGLKGVNSKTDRVCAHTYILEKPFKALTFGTTSHLAHHVEMDIPCLDLYDRKSLEAIEQKLDVKISIKYGILSFIKDIISQFKGPIHIDNLHTGWIESSRNEELETLQPSIEIAYKNRKGIKRRNK